MVVSAGTDRARGSGGVKTRHLPPPPRAGCRWERSGARIAGDDLSQPRGVRGRPRCRRPRRDGGRCDAGHRGAHHRLAAVRSAGHGDTGFRSHRPSGDETDGGKWPARHAAARYAGCHRVGRCLERADEGLCGVDRRTTRAYRRGCDRIRHFGGTGAGSVPGNPDALATGHRHAEERRQGTGGLPLCQQSDGDPACAQSVRAGSAARARGDCRSVRPAEEPELASVPVGVPTAVDSVAGRSHTPGSGAADGGPRRSTVVPHRWRQDGGVSGRGGVHDGDPPFARQARRLRRLARSGGDHALHTAPADLATIPARHRIDLRDGKTPAGCSRSRRWGARQGAFHHWPLGRQQGDAGHDRGQPPRHRGNPQPRQTPCRSDIARATDQLSLVWIRHRAGARGGCR